MALYHGSPVVVDTPRCGYGNPHNDYGLGFYCTQDIEQAREWACQRGHDGFLNEYLFDTDGLDVLDLNDGYTTLEWLAILLSNRPVDDTRPMAASNLEYLLDNFSVDISGYDVIIGRRVDDSYYSFCREFLNGLMTLELFRKVMDPGDVGNQCVLKSPRAFERISHKRSTGVDHHVYHRKYSARMRDAVEDCLGLRKRQSFGPDSLLMTDIARGGMARDDPRLF